MHFTNCTLTYLYVTKTLNEYITTTSTTMIYTVSQECTNFETKTL